MQDSAVASSEGPDYAVGVELSITAKDPTQAAAYALDDLRDRSLGPINFNVTDLASGRTVSVSVGDLPSAQEPENNMNVPHNRNWIAVSDETAINVDNFGYRVAIRVGTDVVRFDELRARLDAGERGADIPCLMEHFGCDYAQACDAVFGGDKSVAMAMLDRVNHLRFVTATEQQQEAAGTAVFAHGVLLGSGRLLIYPTFLNDSAANLWHSADQAVTVKLEDGTRVDWKWNEATCSDITAAEFWQLQRARERLEMGVAAGQDTPTSDERIQLLDAFLDAVPWRIDMDSGQAYLHSDQASLEAPRQ